MADLILIVHSLFILFVTIGSLFVLKMPRLAWIHIPMVLWAAVVNIFGWICPLTPLENYFREISGESVYEIGFLAHYLSAFIYPEWLDYQLGIILGISVFVWNLAIYLLLIHNLKKNK